MVRVIWLTLSEYQNRTKLILTEQILAFSYVPNAIFRFIWNICMFLSSFCWYEKFPNGPTYCFGPLKIEKLEKPSYIRRWSRCWRRFYKICECFLVSLTLVLEVKPKTTSGKSSADRKIGIHCPQVLDLARELIGYFIKVIPWMEVPWVLKMKMVY